MPKIHFFTQADNLPPKAQKEPSPSKEKYRLTNWPAYNKALINRGFITLWLDENTLAQWYYQGPPTRGGVFRYSDQCIQAVLAIKAVFKLAFRQTQGLIQSLLAIMKKDIQVPSYSQLCRRQARLNAFWAPSKPVEAPPEPIHLVVDSTGLKVYGEGDGAARAVESKKARSR